METITLWYNHRIRRQEVMSSNPKCISQGTVAKWNEKTRVRALSHFFHSSLHQPFVTCEPSLCWKDCKDRPQSESKLVCTGFLPMTVPWHICKSPPMYQGWWSLPSAEGQVKARKEDSQLLLCGKKMATPLQARQVLGLGDW